MNFGYAPFETSGSSSPATNDEYDKVIDSIHLQTGLIYVEGFELVRANCTACHSAKWVTQNRATKEGWVQMTLWMQETQGLWDFDSLQPSLRNLALDID